MMQDLYKKFGLNLQITSTPNQVFHYRFNAGKKTIWVYAINIRNQCRFMWYTPFIKTEWKNG